MSASQRMKAPVRNREIRRLLCCIENTYLKAQSRNVLRLNASDRPLPKKALKPTVLEG